MTALYLVRHGETDWNRDKRIQGSSDIPLNEIGREQARTAGRLLARRSFDALAASPLLRATETAQIIGAEIGHDAVEPVPGVVERHYGEAEGMTWEEVDAAFADRERIPGRESRSAVTRRAMPALLDLAGRHRGSRLVVVTHGGVIRALLDAVAPKLEAARAPITNASVHSFSVDDRGLRLVTFDDPVEERSVLPGAGDLDEQNRVEAAL